MKPNVVPVDHATPKEPFDIDRAMALVREAVRPFPKAALFELAEQGYNSPFEQLVACMISIRTRDEVTLPTARQLFARARTPAEVLALGPEALEKIISKASFHLPKSRQIVEIARRVIAEHDGAVPCDRAGLESFPGVGPKCANLVLGIACGQPEIAVDVHVFRVTNRWGYVQAKTPEATMMELEKKLPRRYWVEINALLVPFGKHICTGTLPFCTSCPILPMCQQVGVEFAR